MQYFTIQAGDHWEALEKMKSQYGANARILTRKNIRIGGVLGLFRREGVEIAGYISRQETRSIPVEEEKKKILGGVARDQTMQLILKEVRTLKEELSSSSGSPPPPHPSITRVKELLAINDFTATYTDAIVQRIQKEFSLESLADFGAVQSAVVHWIGEHLRIYSPRDENSVKPRIITVIGPTGVGKTTTIAKLAAIHSLGTKTTPSQQVRMVTIDNYRIAAKKQIETYGEIMQIPVAVAESRSDLEKLIALHQDSDVILIDTIGKSPNDFEKLGEMRSILSACGTLCETYLAISATTKASDIEEILRQFEPFNYKSIILTKLDETSRIGGFLSVILTKGKSLSYITDGQMVPQDIEQVTVARLLQALEGFRVDRDAVESKFGQKNVDTNRRWSE
jgi:flagellar biosynthesis protein FlhF